MAESTTTQEAPNANGAHPPQIVGKDAAYRATSEVTELIRTDAGDFSATNVTMDRSGAEQITAERVSMERSGAKAMTVKSAQLDRSGVLALNADHVVLHESTATVVRAKEARIVRGNVLFFRSDATTVDGELKTLIHIGNACDNVKPVFDNTGAIRFGAALGVVLLLGGRILRGLFGGR